MSLYVGLMSGTSMDGIDVALIDSNAPAQLLAGKTYRYEDALRKKIENLMNFSHAKLPDFFETHRLAGEAFGKVIQTFLDEFSICASQIKGIGSHGQTIYHAPFASPAYSVQIGCPHTIAACTNQTVVADFRTRDLVLGGQGAPLAPLFHQVLFESVPKPLAILNVGGIANITYLYPDGRVTGHDVGPGNALLDAWIEAHLGVPFDADGQWASSGTVIPSLLAACLSDPFFSLPAPKSLDKYYFSKNWLLSKLPHSYLPEDVQATLVALSAEAVKLAMNGHDSFNQLFVCGGGVHNKSFLKDLELLLPQVTIESTQSIGAHPDYIEAMMCAWLAAKTLSYQPLNLEPVTGGKYTLLGCIYPA